MSDENNKIVVKELGPVRALTQGGGHVNKDTRAGHRD